jgi:hypothetical protein
VLNARKGKPAKILLMAGGMFLERKRVTVTISEDPIE